MEPVRRAALVEAAMAEIGRQHARSGQVDKGLGLIKKIQRGSFARNEAFRDVANICTDGGDYKKACEIFKLIPNGSDMRDQIQVYASNYFRNNGDLKMALVAINRVSPASALARTIGLSRISKAYIAQGDFDNGLKLARMMPRGNHLRARTMEHIV